MSNERLQRLEEKIAYLERHVTEQDKVILELGDTLAKLRLELRALRERSGGAVPGDAEQAPVDERPPHY